MKKLFKVTYTETYTKSYVIEAESQEEAEKKANTLAEECEIPKSIYWKLCRIMQRTNLV